MALGDVLVFNEARAYMLDGDWASTDDVKCALLENTTVPTVADVTPALGDYTEVTAAGSYVAGGISLGTYGAAITETLGVMTFDSVTNPNWVQNALNTTTSYWGLLINDTQAGKPAIAFVELGGPVDMTAGDLTITWNVNGIFTIT